VRFLILPTYILLKLMELQSISVEAWINPLRSFTEEEISTLDENYLIYQWYSDEELSARNLMYNGERYYLNPGSQDVIDLVNNVAKELCENYQIAGIHIDDYFYPSGMTEKMDQITYEEFLETHPGYSLKSYRISCTDNLVRTLYKTVNQQEGLTFSVSPHSSFEVNAETYYADVGKWLTTAGYCDLIIPQVYFGFDNETYPFTEVIDSWEKTANGATDLAFGLAAYKVGSADEYAGSGKNEWVANVDVLQRQVEYIKSQKYNDGVVFFRYSYMFNPPAKIRRQMRIELANLKNALQE